MKILQTSATKTPTMPFPLSLLANLVTLDILNIEIEMINQGDSYERKLKELTEFITGLSDLGHEWVVVFSNLVRAELILQHEPFRIHEHDALDTAKAKHALYIQLRREFQLKEGDEMIMVKKIRKLTVKMYVVEKQIPLSEMNFRYLAGKD